MKVTVKSFDVIMELKNNGIELEIRDPQDNFLGDLILTKTRLIWCEGKTTRQYGKEIKWEAFRKYMNAR